MRPCEKPYAPIAAGRSTIDAAVDGFGQRAVEVLRVELADALQRVEAKLAADDRGRQQEDARAVGQRREAVADRLAHAVGDAQPDDLRLAVEAALGAQQAHDLVDEERVALGRVVDRADDAVGCAAPGDALDDLGDVALAQAPQRHALAVADDVAERAGEDRVQARLGLAVGADDEDRRVAHVDREEAEQAAATGDRRRGGRRG